MFSEFDIVDFCRECTGGCSSLHLCPLRMEQAPARKEGVVPFVPGRFPFTDPRSSRTVDVFRNYSTDELITGLCRLNSLF